MTISGWLALFKEHIDIKIFQINHLKLLTSLSDSSLRVSLSRLTKNNTLKRICRGFYANPLNPPTLEEISAQIYQPSYISLESALSSYGILSQIPRVLTCVTTRLPHVFKTGFGTIEYRQVKGPYFTGFVKKNAHCVAQKEKAVADYLYLSPAKGRAQKLAGLDMEGVNLKRLHKYLKKMAMGKGRMGKTWGLERPPPIPMS